MAASHSLQTLVSGEAQSRLAQSECLSLLGRLIAVAGAVILCYRFEWQFLRYLTLESNVRLDALLGVHLERLAYDTVIWSGTAYRYGIACTFADVWCGAIALLYSSRRGVLQNLQLMCVFTVALFCFNVVRLSVSDLIFAVGVSWVVAHEVVSGIAYFLVWLWIWPNSPLLHGLLCQNPLASPLVGPADP